jgi:hypothetical protein
MTGKRQAPPHPDWFNIDLYTVAEDLDLRGWSTQIGNRIHLRTLLEIGNQTEFDRLFKRIQTNPFDDLGFRATFAAISPLKYGIAREVVKAMAKSKCEANEICDVALAKIHPEIYSRQAHLLVNLQATEQEIRNHFNNWLMSTMRKDRSRFPRERDFALDEEVLKKRHAPEKSPILPHQDLLLWFQREGNKPPSDSIMADWLQIAGTDDVVRQMRKNTSRVFSIQYCHDLNHAAAPHFS